MQEIVSPLQSISYTNKDFQRIYPELLELVKQLTNKWDPSISNESDPGVILIKLNALIADKCNYNIDKNVLECFPLSVTQTKNARQLFEQLGYRMKWYRSASAFISLKWVGETLSGVNYTIPAFTMITDTEKTIVYTLVGTVPTMASQEFIVSPLQLSSDGTTLNAKAIQGIAVKYDINGDTIITPQHLDQDNRIYFNVSDVAENGIFITNTGASNYSSWIQKDNLLVEEYGNTFYKFGVSADGSLCYLEFPEDAETIMKDGIEITYIRTLGQYGKVKPQQLRQFYSDISVVSSLNEPTVLSTQNVSLINYFASTSGYDAETINEAYKNYKRIIGTYNTLITLRDYLNYILSNNLASNGFTCDRSNDIQTTYDIMEYSNGLNIRTNVIDKDENNVPLLSAFSLKLYLLKYFSDVSTAPIFNDSFVLQNSQELQNTKEYIADLKMLSHDYAPILPSTATKSNICFFKNKYPLECTVIPQYKLSLAQELELKNNIYTALFNNLNSKEIEFGEEISSNYLRNVIQSADSRIKNVILDNIEYRTYAVYIDENGNSQEVQVSGDIPPEFTAKAVHPDGSIIPGTFTLDSQQIQTTLVRDDLYKHQTYVFTLEQTGRIPDWSLNGQPFTGEPGQIGILFSTSSELGVGDKYILELSKSTQFREDIYVKSILAGITPFFFLNEEVDSKFDQSLASSDGINYNLEYSDVKTLSSYVDIIFTSNQKYFKLRPNESIQLFSPNFLQSAIYNNYVKFEINLTSSSSGIQEETYYELRDGEYIIFYWKSSSSTSLYQFAIYGSGSIIKPSFSLFQSSNLTQTGQEQYQSMISQNLNKMQGTLDVYSSGEIISLTASENILSSNKEIGYYVSNTHDINNDYLCYWVLNHKEISNNKQYYTLFEDGETEYILEPGEYFFYSRNELESLVSLGSGTRLIRDSSEGTWTVNAIDITDITLNGISILSNYWFKIDPGVVVTVEEDQIISIKQDQTLRLDLRSQSNYDPIEIKKTGVYREETLLPNLNDYIVSYTNYPWVVSIEEVPESEWTYLSAYNFQNFAGWNARSILSISCSKDLEQILFDKQNIIITDINDTSFTISGGNKITDSQSNFYPVVIRTNKSVSMTGLSDYNTVSYDGNLNEVYLNMYVYKKQLTRTNIVTYFNQNMSIIIPAGSSSSDTTNPPKLALPKGVYVFGITVPDLPDNYYVEVSYKEISGFKVCFSPIYDISNTRLNGSKLYPCYLQFDDIDREYSFVVDLYEDDDNSSTVNPSVNAPSNLSILFSNLHLWKTETGEPYDDELQKIILLMNQYDPEHKFNYFQQISEESQIKDPLKASEFLNLNHIYHDFTICQLDTSSLNDLKVNYS